MASTARLREDANDLISCPVCYEHYQDPRILQCAHQFCLRCLQQVKMAARQDHKHICCPQCRTITHLSDTGLKGLPRPVLMNKAQDVIRGLLNKSAGDRGGDRTVTQPEVDTVICEVHEEIITKYCYTCEVCMCRKCRKECHRGHTTGDRDVAADRAREQVTQFIQQQLDMKLTPEDRENIHDQMDTLTSEREKVLKDLSDTVQLLRKVLKRVKAAKTEVEMTTEANIASLQQYLSQIEELDESKESLVELSLYLVGEASDGEVLSRIKELPSPENVSALTSPPIVSTPTLSTELDKLQSTLNTLLHNTLYNT